MSRLSLGPNQAGVVQKPDAPVSIAAVNQGGSVDLVIPAQDFTVYNRPTRLHVLFLGENPAPGADPAAVLAGATLKASADAAPDPGNAQEARQTIAVPGVTPGTYFVQVVLEFSE